MYPSGTHDVATKHPQGRGQCEIPFKQGDPESGARGTRTPDLLGAIQALSQLSYSPGRRRVPRGFATV
jgi:hypothetical protein